MLQENNQAVQLSLLSPAELAKVEVESGLSPTWMQEEETAPSTSGGVCKAPCSGESTLQERLPGIDWSK
jgi:hypothetical protein